MKILINGAALKVAGPKTLLINLLNALAISTEENTYFVIVPEKSGYEDLVLDDRFTMKYISLRLLNPICRLLVDNFCIKRMIRLFEPDIILSMGNIALPVISVPQIVLFHHSFLIYPDGIFWNRLTAKQTLYFKIQSKIIKSRFKYATRIVTQTEVAKNRLSKILKKRRTCLTVIPNGVSIQRLKVRSNDSRYLIELHKYSTSFKFICLSRYYRHKNIEVLIEVAKLIKLNNKPYRIFITIAPDQHTDAEKLIWNISQTGLEDIIINLGELPSEIVPELYLHSDALILPTLLESYSGTYIEAAFFGKPIFTSHLDFAVEVCGDSAIYFNPLSPMDIFNKMSVIEDPDIIESLIAKGSKRVAEAPSWDDIAKAFLQLSNQILVNE